MGVDLGRRAGPVDPGLGRSDLLRIGRFAGLGRALDRPAFDGGQRPGPEAGADVGHAFAEAGGGVVGADVENLGQQDRALVEALGHAHDLDAGLAVAGHDGPLDGGGAAPAGQQGAVQVETAEPGRVEHLALEDLAVGDDAGGVDLEAAEGLDRLGRLHRGGGEDRQAHGLGEGVDRRGRQLLAAAARSGRLGVYRHNLMARGDELGQRGHGEVGSSHEGEAHGRGCASGARRGQGEAPAGRCCGPDLAGMRGPLSTSYRTLSTSPSHSSSAAGPWCLMCETAILRHLWSELICRSTHRRHSGWAEAIRSAS